MREVAIEGLDGTGKTTVAQGLASHLKSEGFTPVVFAPYRMVREKYGEIYPLWKSNAGAELAIGLLKNSLAQCRAQAHAQKADIVIYDRHWMTAFTEIGAKPDLIQQWGENFVTTAYLRVDPQTARTRAQGDLGESWMESRNYDNYALRYQALCKDYGSYLLGIYRNDDDVDIGSIVRNIAWDMKVVR